MNLRTDYQKLEHGKKAGPLTARQLWKLKHLSYLKPFYKQGHKSVQGSGAVGGALITSTELELDDDQKPELDDRGHESSSSSRKETPTKIPVLNCPTQMRKTKKQRETDKGEKSTSFDQIMEVMKESAGHLVTRARTAVSDPCDQERDSFFQWLNEFTSRMPRQTLRDFQRQCIQLAMHFTPPDSPQANPPRPRISQGPSASSHAQHPMDPPPRPAPTASGGYIEMLQSQPQYGGGGGGGPNQMVSNFLFYFFKEF